MRAGANVKAANRDGATPLSLASTNGDAAMMAALVKGRGRSERAAADREDQPHAGGAQRQS